MKELSIEEKAKRYDEAIEIAKEINNEQRAQPFNVMTRVFPELRESEDERIRKRIIDLIKEVVEDDSYHVYRFDEMIAWLEKQGGKELVTCPICGWEIEKQGRQKPADKVKTKFKVGDEIKTINEVSLIITRIDRWGYWSEDLFICNFDDADKWELVKQKPAFKVGDVIRLKGSAAEYTIKRVTDTTYYTDGWSCGIERCEEDYELVKQKPNNDLPKGEDYGIDGLWHAERILEKTLGEVEGYQSDDGILEHKCAISSIKELKKMKQQNWSEEDVAMLDSAIAFVEHSAFTTIGKGKNNVIAWLKSIRDKAQPQPQQNQEWSEEDEDAIAEAIIALEDMYDPDEPERCYAGYTLTFDKAAERLKSLRPKSQWKPDSSMLICLEYAIKHINKEGDKRILSKLLEQLKKLREE